MNAPRASVALLSGGLLSAVALASATHQTEVKVALHFATARHAGEDFRAASRVAHHFGLNLEAASLPSVIVGDVADREPGAYMAMLTLGSLYARRIGAGELWTGMNRHVLERPDASPRVITDLVRMVRGATGATVAITTSEHMTRVEAFKVAADLGILELVLEHTIDCDVAPRGRQHEWGPGCGACAGCRARAASWELFRRLKGVLP